jgi:hypothetical protein
MIVKIDESPLKNKRYRVTLDNGKTYDFGLKGGSTYIDHKDKNKRENYRKRHIANTTERNLIEYLVPSPALFSYALLWGPYTSLQENIAHLNATWVAKKRRP